MRSEILRTCVVLISADAEWEAVVRNFPESSNIVTPFGGYFENRHKDWKIIYCQGGWGKVSAAASTQYAISTWQPDLVVNLGTCGGFAGRINQGEIILAARTSIYDIVERMGDMKAALDFYTVAADLSWLAGPFPHAVRQEILVSADQDISPGMIPLLIEQFNASASDWESGAIAWVAAKNHTPCLILRGVSDLVDEKDGEAYEKPELFASRAAGIMDFLIKTLPDWLDCVKL
ncbi:MAG: 5'-methylthioadenosine/S-adenosylhomocysteine nucleosidase [Anaerolineaceae bacterium]